MGKFIDRHLRALSIAKECGILGARVRTVMLITGLSRSETVRILVDEGAFPKSGKHPESPEWLHKCNLFSQIEASIFISMYRRFRSHGISPSESLVTAFKHYLVYFDSKARLNFDRAFNLVCHIDGIWSCTKPSMSLLICTTCRSQYLSSLCHPMHDHRNCPFCKLIDRYKWDKRVQDYLPSRPLEISDALHVGLLSPLLGNPQNQHKAKNHDN